MPHRMPTFVTLAMVSIADADVNPERTGFDANRTMKPMFNVPRVNTARETVCPTQEQCIVAGLSLSAPQQKVIAMTRRT